MLQYSAVIENKKTTRGTVSRYFLARLAAGGRYYVNVAEFKEQSLLEQVVNLLNGTNK